MEYLVAHFPRSSPLHERMPTLANVNAIGGSRFASGVVYYIAQPFLSAPIIRCRPIWGGDGNARMRG